MADTIKLPFAGDVKKQYVYLGGAALGGVLVYAYYSRGKALREEAETEAEPEFYEGTYPYISSGGAGPTAVEEEEDTGRIETNGEWSQFVIDYMQRYGYEATVVSSAIGKFLGRQPLTEAEATIVRTALGIAGEPPQDRPWQVILAGPSAPGAGLLAPTNLKAKSIAANHITWHWDPVTGAESYDVELIAGVSTVLEKATIGETAWTPGKSLQAAHSYRINVWAKDTDGKKGAKATNVAQTSAAAPKKGITLTADPMRTAIRWRWGRVPGATRYVIWPIIAGKKQPQKGSTSTTWTWTGLQPNHRYAVEVVAMQGNKEISVRKVHSAVTKK